MDIAEGTQVGILESQLNESYILHPVVRRSVREPITLNLFSQRTEKKH